MHVSNAARIADVSQVQSACEGGTHAPEVGAPALWVSSRAHARRPPPARCWAVTWSQGVGGCRAAEVPPVPPQTVNQDRGKADEATRQQLSRMLLGMADIPALLVHLADRLQVRTAQRSTAERSTCHCLLGSCTCVPCVHADDLRTRTPGSFPACARATPVRAAGALGVLHQGAGAGGARHLGAPGQPAGRLVLQGPAGGRRLPGEAPFGPCRPLHWACCPAHTACSGTARFCQRLKGDLQSAPGNQSWCLARQGAAVVACCMDRQEATSAQGCPGSPGSMRRPQQQQGGWQQRALGSRER